MMTIHQIGAQRNENKGRTDMNGGKTMNPEYKMADIQKLDKEVLIKKLEGLSLLYGLGEVIDILLKWMKEKLHRHFVLEGE